MRKKETWSTSKDTNSILVFNKMHCIYVVFVSFIDQRFVEIKDSLRTLIQIMNTS